MAFLEEKLSRLSEEVRSSAVRAGGDVFWPYWMIPKVIEAVRAAHGISLGGDLILLNREGAVCECADCGVAIFPHELTGNFQADIERSAAISSEKIAHLGGSERLIEAARRCNADILEYGLASGQKITDMLYFSWVYRFET